MEGKDEFLMALHEFISSPASPYICWTELGTSFIISDTLEFRSLLINSSRFAHSRSFTRFLSKLRGYGFLAEKIRTYQPSQEVRWEIFHPKFLRDYPELMSELKENTLEDELAYTLQVGDPYSQRSAGAELNTLQPLSRLVSRSRSSSNGSDTSSPSNSKLSGRLRSSSNASDKSISPSPNYSRSSSRLSQFESEDEIYFYDDEPPGDEPESDGLEDDMYSLEGVDLTGQVVKLQSYPFECGTVADVYRGEWDSGRKRTVAIKIFRRMHTDPETLRRSRKRLYHEARTWSTLSHPNILLFLGICRDLAPSPALVSPLCPHGPVMKYLNKYRKSGDERLELIVGIADGLAHLHSQGIVHGNLSTSKILVDENENPVICGYGMSKVLNQPGQSTSVLPSAVRFTAPEYFALDNGNSARTMAGDVYAFSMVMLEILSGVQPYHDFPSDHSVLFHIVRGGRPLRTDFVPDPISNELWALLMQLWNQLPSFRPGMDAVLDHLHEVKSGNGISTIHPDILQTSLAMEIEDRSIRDLTMAKDSSSSSGEETSFGDLSLPEYKSIDLTGRIQQDDVYPFAGGGNSNLYRGKLLRRGKKSIRVAIKMIRISDDGSGQAQDTVRKLQREAEIWSRLSHKNLLPFLGVCYDIAPWPVLVSPFYKNGHVQKFLYKNPNANRPSLILGVASGLEYLHSKDVVHGDLKVQNVLIDKQGNACICDFGISKVVGARGFTTSSVGTAPYMAPELFFVVDAIDQIKTTPKTTKQSDIYSFGLLALEILTSKPLKTRPTRPIITSKARDTLRPLLSDYQPSVGRAIWSVLDKCWAFNPSHRPTIIKLSRELRPVLSVFSSPRTRFPHFPPSDQLSFRVPKSASGSTMVKRPRNGYALRASAPPFIPSYLSLPTFSRLPTIRQAPADVSIDVTPRQSLVSTDITPRSSISHTFPSGSLPAFNSRRSFSSSQGWETKTTLEPRTVPDPRSRDARKLSMEVTEQVESDARSKSPDSQKTVKKTRRKSKQYS